jgi:hypothetical protein
MTLIWTSNELLTGQKFQNKRPRVAFKNGRQSFSGTTSDQFDADLKIDLPSTSAKYLVEVNYGTSGSTAADITLAWNVTGGASVTRTMQAMALAGTSSSSTEIISRELSEAGWGAGTATTPAPCAVREKLLVTTSTEPCTLTLVWHQNVSNAAWTSIHDYSWAIARRLT